MTAATSIDSVAGTAESPNHEVLVAAATGAAAATGSANGLRSTLRTLGNPPSKPAAMTVMRTSSPRVSSIVVP